MWLKLVGSILVILAGTWIGFLTARFYSERPRQIGQLISCIVSLKSYIHYVAMPLPEALTRCTSGVEGPIAALWQTAAQELTHNGYITPQEAISRAVANNKENLALRPAELEALALLGANLGSMNREEQQKYLDLVQEQLEKLEYEAVAARDPNMKMCRYLGICGSLAVVILLF